MISLLQVLYIEIGKWQHEERQSFSEKPSHILTPLLLQPIQNKEQQKEFLIIQLFAIMKIVREHCGEYR